MRAEYILLLKTSVTSNLYLNYYFTSLFYIIFYCLCTSYVMIADD